MEGSIPPIPSEGAIDQPPGLNNTRGTSKGSWMLTERGETGPIPSEGPVAKPPGRFATECRPAAPKHENEDEHYVVVMFPRSLSSLCFPRILIEKYSESFLCDIILWEFLSLGSGHFL